MNDPMVSKLEWLAIIGILVFCIYSGTVEAEEYLGACDMHPDQIVEEVLDIATLDDVVGFSADEFIAPWYLLWGEGSEWPFEPEAYARYFFMDNSVHLNTRAMMQFGALEQCSIIAHEITHALQFQTGVKFDAGTLEGHAYQIQDLFMRRHLEEYNQRYPAEGNGMIQVRQFKKMQRIMAEIESNDLAGLEPVYCSGDSHRMICEW